VEDKQNEEGLPVSVLKDDKSVKKKMTGVLQDALQDEVLQSAYDTLTPLPCVMFSPFCLGVAHVLLLVESRFSCMVVKTWCRRMATFNIL
jgi:hypothetical protein